MTWFVTDKSLIAENESLRAREKALEATVDEYRKSSSSAWTQVNEARESVLWWRQIHEKGASTLKDALKLSDEENLRLRAIINDMRRPQTPTPQELG